MSWLMTNIIRSVEMYNSHNLAIKIKSVAKERKKVRTRLHKLKSA